MKKRFWLLVASILTIAVFVGVIYLRVNRVNMEFAKEVEVCFIYGDTDTLCRLGDEELESLKAVFNGKKMYQDNLSCGFSEAISIKFNKAQTFCIARDTCPIVYWKEEDRYIKLSEEEKIQLYHLLEPYGFFFPCD